jgi:glycosyltransferase involved in cell wall biosynthesis
MKVLHIITRMNQGGTARWLDQISGELSDVGWQSVIVSGVVGKSEVEDESFHRLQGIRVTSLGKGKGPVNDLRAFIELRRIIMSVEPDIINTHTSKAGVLGRIAGFSIPERKKRVIHTYHGHLLYGYFPKPITWVVVIIEKLMSNITDEFIVSGKSVCEQLVDVGIGAEDKFSVINPGVKNPLRIEKTIARSRFGIPAESIVVGWMGRFEDVKAPNRVLELAGHFPGVIFLMAGTGKLFEEIKSLAPSNLILPGWSDANQIWSATDIALLTSLNEAQPIALIEAGLLGIPSVADDIGSVSEVVIDGQSGFLCKTFDDRSEALKLLIGDIDLREKMGRYASSYCAAQFSTQNFAEAHIRVYKGTKDR